MAWHHVNMQALASALNEASELLWALLAQQGTAKIESSPEVAAAGESWYLSRC